MIWPSFLDSIGLESESNDSLPSGGGESNSKHSSGHKGFQKKKGGHGKQSFSAGKRTSFNRKGGKSHSLDISEGGDFDENSMNSSLSSSALPPQFSHQLENLLEENLEFLLSSKHSQQLQQQQQRQSQLQPSRQLFQHQQQQQIPPISVAVEHSRNASTTRPSAFFSKQGIEQLKNRSRQVSSIRIKTPKNQQKQKPSSYSSSSTETPGSAEKKDDSKEESVDATNSFEATPSFPFFSPSQPEMSNEFNISWILEKIKKTTASLLHPSSSSDHAAAPLSSSGRGHRTVSFDDEHIGDGKSRPVSSLATDREQRDPHSSSFDIDNDYYSRKMNSFTPPYPPSSSSSKPGSSSQQVRQLKSSRRLSNTNAKKRLLSVSKVDALKAKYSKYQHRSSISAPPGTSKGQVIASSSSRYNSLLSEKRGKYINNQYIAANKLLHKKIIDLSIKTEMESLRSSSILPTTTATKQNKKKATGIMKEEKDVETEAEMAVAPEPASPRTVSRVDIRFSGPSSSSKATRRIEEEHHTANLDTFDNANQFLMSSPFITTIDPIMSHYKLEDPDQFITKGKWIYDTSIDTSRPSSVNDMISPNRHLSSKKNPITIGSCNNPKIPRKLLRSRQ
jgi:hypothetical protein